MLDRIFFPERGGWGDVDAGPIKVDIGENNEVVT